MIFPYCPDCPNSPKTADPCFISCYVYDKHNINLAVLIFFKIYVCKHESKRERKHIELKPTQKNWSIEPKLTQKNCSIVRFIFDWCSQYNGPIFLRRFKLYMFSFTFGIMFANICFIKNQNSKIFVMFIINITWNETGICSFWAVWAVRAVGKNQVLTCASLVC